MATTQAPTVDAVLDKLEALYARAVDAQRAALRVFAETGRAPTASERDRFVYPQVLVSYDPDGPHPRLSRAYGVFTSPGRYSITVTRPDLFRPYLSEQLALLNERYRVDIRAEPSGSEIPYPYVMGPEEERALAAIDPRATARAFATPDLSRIDDTVADGASAATLGAQASPGETRPLALFDAVRTDYSLSRLRHYTGAPGDHVQDYILFTNYNRYVAEFLEWALAALTSGRYTGLSVPGEDGVIGPDHADPAAAVAAAMSTRAQMPAYHLMAGDRSGVTLVNIGVGPSNAKNITDHLAVLRPQCWLMIGHCGGLRQEQRLGDYVLAHAYLRRDRVLDEHVPLEVPVPPIAEIQIALQEAAGDVLGVSGAALKDRLRTGTVVTNVDRNWELRASQEAGPIHQSRAVAVDMESATIAANGYRLRVPYGTLLCVSDKPLHGELKLPGPARRFYDEAVGQHLKIGLRTLERLKANGAEALHSRKLRAFDEPPFR